MWKELLALVKSVIKANGKGAITGSNLQEVVNTIITTLGENATYKGLADPTTIPSLEDGPVFYLAVEGGNYENFNKDIFLPDGISVLKSNVDSIGGQYWEGVNLLSIDETITKDGEGLVRAKLIYSGFRSLGLYNYQEFDIWKTYGVGTKLLYNGELIEITKEHSPGELTEFEYKLATVTASSGGDGAQADWDEPDEKSPSYIRNKPDVLKITGDGYLRKKSNGYLDIDNRVLVLNENEATENDEDIILFFDRTINKANKAIDEIENAIMELGSWKLGVDFALDNVSNQLKDASGSEPTLNDRLQTIENDSKKKIPYSDIKRADNVDWNSSTEVVSPVAISKHIEDKVATLMTGRVTLQGRWSSISAEGNLNILPGYQYIYDRGNMPVGIELEPGDILTALKPIKTPAERDNKDNWVVAQGNLDYANLEGRVNDIEAEVRDARNGENNVSIRLNKIDDSIAKIDGEVKQLNKGQISLSERIAQVSGVANKSAKEISEAAGKFVSVEERLNDTDKQIAGVNELIADLDSTKLTFEVADNINDLLN